MSNPYENSAPARLVSQLLVDDPDMTDIVEEFVNELPARIVELCEAHREMDWESLRTCAHRLKGAGGSYGYPGMSEVAANMEAAFAERRDDQFSDLLGQLEQLVKAAQAGITALQ